MIYNVGTSFTDLMANAFMIISLFLLLALVKSVLMNDELVRYSSLFNAGTTILQIKKHNP
jgi:hypothetical protein